MILTKEKRSLDFRKETIQIIYHYYKCADSEEHFTTTALDEVNINQLYNHYRNKFNIPFPDEIARIREKYGLSATKMAEVLGFGINSYRQYEAGEMPSVANAKLIQMADDPASFIHLVELCGTWDNKMKTKYIHIAQLLVEEQKRNSFTLNFKDYLLGNHMADIYSGFRNPNLDKFTEMVVYFANKTSPFKTKMNKLLFYADFLMFKESCFSISGMRYKAIDMGPVPNNFQSIFEYLSNENIVDIIYTPFPQGTVGELFKARGDRPYRPEVFLENELAILEKVASAFQSATTHDLIEQSHLEKAWQINAKDKHIISYEYAFDLNPI